MRLGNGVRTNDASVLSRGGVVSIFQEASFSGPALYL